ncbi:uncharacterized protein [Triticum aestivum]|uniref:uncharacterized protein n=1 Tax=Triticum aestivum TaxID=4565 RepID=UPI001D020779|nr:uncharacterized protein LOC123158366 [Triticum aestivum]
MGAMEKRLKEMGIRYMKRTINEEEGSPIDQLFFKDPDGFMIEICNCENLELVPAGALGRLRLPRDRHNPPLRMDGGARRARGRHGARDGARRPSRSLSGVFKVFDEMSSTT